MKKTILLIATTLVCTMSNAAPCFSNNELNKLKEIHKESSEFYSRVKFDCKSTNQVAQKICKSQEHKLIAEVQLRTGIYDYENATHTELTGNAYKSEYSSSFKWITQRYDNCSQLKSSLIEIMSTSIWAN
ncbi:MULTISPECIES: hypothetical protein [Acinetobacter]|uniref:hypothetical protein n=1 Tax=Acinetobacter TaxID=469 RepID=UPI0015B6E97A|nr:MULTISPECIES: hypothetical protein [Acinetobacter]MBT0888430.1 hypothetical protein [Acinetobacter towneri]NWJ93835.1 hypothetical protein [Acinetobacter sp. Swhac1]